MFPLLLLSRAEESEESEEPVLLVYHVNPNPYTKPPEEDMADNDTVTTMTTDATTDNYSTTTPGTSPGTSTRTPVCSTTTMSGSTGSTGSSDTTTPSGTTTTVCQDPPPDVVEEEPKNLAAVIENDPIGKLPEDEWSLCASKFYNIWTQSRASLYLQNGDKAEYWFYISPSFRSVHFKKHTDTEDQKLYGYMYFNDVSAEEVQMQQLGILDVWQN